MSDTIDQNNEPPRPDTAIPHARETGWEMPVQEFDKTPLAEAIDQGLLGDAPHDASALVDTPSAEAVAPESAVPESEEHKKRLWPKMVAGAFALAAVAGSVVVARSGSGEAKPKAVPAATSDAGAQPSSPSTQTDTSPETSTTLPETNNKLKSPVKPVQYATQETLTATNALLVVRSTIDNFKGYVQTLDRTYLKASLSNLDDFPQFVPYLTKRGETLEKLYELGPWYKPYDMRIGDTASLTFDTSNMQATFVLETHMPDYIASQPSPPGKLMDDIIAAQVAKITYAQVDMALIDPVTHQTKLQKVWVATGVSLGEATFTPVK